MDQVGDPVPDRSGNEQSCQRLFSRISTDRSTRPSALLINCGGGLSRLVCDVASGALDRVYRLNPGARGLLSEVGGLIHRRPGAFAQIPQYGLGLIDLVLHRFLRLSGEVTDCVPNLCRCIAHDILTLLLIHPLLPTQMAFRPYQLPNRFTSRHDPCAIVVHREISQRLARRHRLVLMQRVFEFSLTHLRTSWNVSPASLRIELCTGLLSVMGSLAPVLLGCALSCARVCPLQILPIFLFALVF